MITFKDHPEFKPRLRPDECIRRGIFGGIYFNPKGGKAGIFGRHVDIDHREFPKSWFKGLHENMYIGRKYDASINKYGVVSGSDQAYWEAHGWIHPQDPRGWFQWYCRFYMGRRSPDDERQIKRWLGVCGDNGRWRRALLKKIKSNRDSAKIRQTLLHWAFELKKSDTSEFT